MRLNVDHAPVGSSMYILSKHYPRFDDIKGVVTAAANPPDIEPHNADFRAATLGESSLLMNFADHSHSGVYK